MASAVYALYLARPACTAALCALAEDSLESPLLLVSSCRCCKAAQAPFRAVSDWLFAPRRAPDRPVQPPSRPETRRQVGPSHRRYRSGQWSSSRGSFSDSETLLTVHEVHGIRQDTSKARSKPSSEPSDGQNSTMTRVRLPSSAGSEPAPHILTLYISQDLRRVDRTSRISSPSGKKCTIGTSSPSSR